MSATEAFIRARELLFRHRDDWDAAYTQFRWPELDRFNWALDWFDVLSRKNDRRALWVVGDDDAGRDRALTYAELSERSSRVPNHLRALGVARGDRVVVMLGNVIPLWETVLACAKLGAVVIPSTTQLTPADVADRFDRGGAKHVITDADGTAKFAAAPAHITRIAAGDPSPGGIASSCSSITRGTRRARAKRAAACRRGRSA